MGSRAAKADTAAAAITDFGVSSFILFLNPLATGFLLVVVPDFPKIHA